MVEHGNLVAIGQWSIDESSQNSTWHKLRAVRLVLESFQSKLENERMRQFTDNQNVMRIVQHGSRVTSLQAEALMIFAVCVASYIHVEPEWVFREQNELVDYYSSLIDYDDWRLNLAVLNGQMNYGDLTPGSGYLAQKQQTILLVTGAQKTIGGAYQYT